MLAQQQTTAAVGEANQSIANPRRFNACTLPPGIPTYMGPTTQEQSVVNYVLVGINTKRARYKGGGHMGICFSGSIVYTE